MSGSIATPQMAPTLPSFAQAFSSSSLNRISSGATSLPPIHPRQGSEDSRRVRDSPQLRTSDDPPTNVRKRSRTEITTLSKNHDNSSPSSPSPRVKEEPEQDMLDPSPPPSAALKDTSGAPPPSSVHPHPPSKKRRMTISGAPALNTDVRLPADQTNSTPISPLVMGFTVQRDNPNEVEQVRSMLSVKQKQKALIEQRRGSVAGITTMPANVIPAISSEDRSTKSTPPAARATRRSPNANNTSNGTRRPNHSNRPATPPAPSSSSVTTQSSQHHHFGSTPGPPNGAHQSLPPPPISFARRRANQLGTGGRKKPADILISPREEQTAEQFAPSIQSAPPIPHAGRGGGFYSMTIPRLPSVMGSGSPEIPRVKGLVPPTPTRLASLQSSQQSQAIRPIPSIANRSPPNASVAIASNLVPPTPRALQHPSYSNDKAAFLAPFEVFYEALNDSKQLKGWLSEQLNRTNSLMQTLTQQQEKMQETVESLVEKKTAGMRSEISTLHRRVEELEETLRQRGGSSSKGRNGPADSYTFPPLAERERERLDRYERRVPSPGWPQEPAPASMDMAPDEDLYRSRRPSLTSRNSGFSQRQASEDPSARVSFHSPPAAFRDSGKLFRTNSSNALGSRSSPRILSSVNDKEMVDGTRKDERRNSIQMSPPPATAEDRDA